MVYAGQRAEKSQRGMHLNAAGERRSSTTNGSSARACARSRPEFGESLTRFSLLISLSHIELCLFPTVYNTLALSGSNARINKQPHRTS